MQMSRRDQLEFVKDSFYVSFLATIRIAEICRWKKVRNKLKFVDQKVDQDPKTSRRTKYQTAPV
jgi:hypothetical protein